MKPTDLNHRFTINDVTKALSGSYMSRFSETPQLHIPQTVLYEYTLKSHYSPRLRRWQVAFSTLTFNNRKINGYKQAKMLVLKLLLATEAPTGLINMDPWASQPVLLINKTTKPRVCISTQPDDADATGLGVMSGGLLGNLP